MRTDVVALYVDPLGPYPKLVAEWYDSARDARTYAGDCPVVAHPPCGPWGRLKHLSRRIEDRALFDHALSTVRRVGGVIEHPAFSRAFAHHSIPYPGEFPDGFGGRTFEVSQCDFGHVARKKTWLYVVGLRELPPLPPAREPTHWISGWRNATGPRGAAPAGIKICSKTQRNRTPEAFAEFLISIAHEARR